jgi:hypothetical protein
MHTYTHTVLRKEEWEYFVSLHHFDNGDREKHGTSRSIKFVYYIIKVGTMYVYIIYKINKFGVLLSYNVLLG